MSTTTPTPTDWQWYPASQCYYSPSTGISAIQDPQTGGWTYRSNVGSQDQDVESSRVVDTVASFSKSARGGGIGDVGWALEADLDAGPSHEQDEKKNGTTTAVDLPEKNALDTTAMTAAATSTNDHVALSEATTGEATHRIQPMQTATAAVPKILRLVLLPSSSTSSTTTTSAQQTNKPRVAILDSRPSGYLIGRDRSLGSAVLRVKEMGVSRVHARVWRGFSEEEEEEDGIEVRQEGGQRNREKAWWIVDCGSTHGTFLSRPTPSSSPKTPLRLSASRSSSLPHKLTHGTLLTLGTTCTFSCHLHADWPCDECALGDLPALGIDDPLSSSNNGTPDPQTSLANNNTSSDVNTTAAGQWIPVEVRQAAMTSHAKKVETSRRAGRAMASLKEKYFGSSAPTGAGNGAAGLSSVGSSAGGWRTAGGHGGPARGKAGKSGKGGAKSGKGDKEG